MMRNKFERQLAELNNMLIEMGGLIENIAEWVVFSITGVHGKVKE